jgi:hypothetical protein
MNYVNIVLVYMMLYSQSGPVGSRLGRRRRISINNI